jgi:hypothetical protein
VNNIELKCNATEIDCRTTLFCMYGVMKRVGKVEEAEEKKTEINTV